MNRHQCHCGALAECSSPEPLCRLHAIAFFEAVVRVGAGLAELHREAATGEADAIRWLPLPPILVSPSHDRIRQACRLCPLPRARLRGTLCVQHLYEAQHRAGTPRAHCRIPGCREPRETFRGKLCAEHRREAYLRSSAAVTAVLRERRAAALR